VLASDSKPFFPWLEALSFTSKLLISLLGAIISKPKAAHSSSWNYSSFMQKG